MSKTTVTNFDIKLDYLPIKGMADAFMSIDADMVAKTEGYVKGEQNVEYYHGMLAGLALAAQILQNTPKEANSSYIVIMGLVANAMVNKIEL